MFSTLLTLGATARAEVTAGSDDVPPVVSGDAAGQRSHQHRPAHADDPDAAARAVNRQEVLDDAAIFLAEGRPVPVQDQPFRSDRPDVVVAIAPMHGIRRGPSGAKLREDLSSPTETRGSGSSKNRIVKVSGSKVARLAAVAANAVRNFDLSRAI